MHWVYFYPQLVEAYAFIAKICNRDGCRYVFDRSIFYMFSYHNVLSMEPYEKNMIIMFYSANVVRGK